MTKLHVVTVHHRGQEMFALCLESLLAQEGVELEIVVVANGERVNLPPVASESERIHVVHTGRSIGFGEANNLGVRWAVEHLGPCDAYYFVNNDTLSEPGSSAELARALFASSEVGVVGPTLVIWGAEDHFNSLGLNVTEDAWGWDEGIGVRRDEYGEVPGERDVLGVTGSAVLVRSEVFEAVGGWPEIYEYYFEDIDLCVRAWRLGWRVRQVPTATVRHRISATMTEGSERKELFFWRNRLILALVHWPTDKLLALARRALGPELTQGTESEVALRTKAIEQALDLVPQALELRREVSGTAVDWVTRLRPTGSVPVITLPDACYRGAEEPVPAGSGASALKADRWAENAPGSDGADGGDAGDAVTATRRCFEPELSRTVVVVGWGPLPFDEAKMHYAPGARTWQLALEAAASGANVAVLTARIAGTGADPAIGRVERRDGIVTLQCSEDQLGGPWLSQYCESLGPDVVIGATPIPSRWAAQVANHRPLWVDLFGELMSEGQAKSLGSAGEQVVAYHGVLEPLLRRGDLFTVVSERQKWAVVGQLGLVGRLDASTAGTDLVHVLPCAAPQSTFQRDGGGDAGLQIAEDAFVVLWSGSYNTWCDVDTLFEGLEQAMAAVPSLRFVSTGGVVEGHDEATYPLFERLVGSSRFANRYHLLGRVEPARVAALTRRADLGVITEKRLYERQLGSSQRLAGWVGVGLPFVCTTLSELGEAAVRAGLGHAYQAGDPRSLAETLVSLASRDGSVRVPTVSPLPEPDSAAVSAWLRSPTTTGDSVRTVSERRSKELEALQAAYHEARNELGEIHHSRMWSIWMQYYDVVGAIRRLFGRSR